MRFIAVSMIITSCSVTVDNSLQCRAPLVIHNRATFSRGGLDRWMKWPMFADSGSHWRRMSSQCTTFPPTQIPSMSLLCQVQIFIRCWTYMSAAAKSLASEYDLTVTHVVTLIACPAVFCLVAPRLQKRVLTPSVLTDWPGRVII